MLIRTFLASLRRPARRQRQIRRFIPSLELLENRLSPALSISPATLPIGAIGNFTSGDYTYDTTSPAITASGGTAPYAYTLSGSLPTGVSFSSNSATAKLAGFALQTGIFSITVSATDSLGATGSINYQLVINPTLTLSPASVAAGTVGTSYTQTITASGGTAPYTFHLGDLMQNDSQASGSAVNANIASTLPPGLGLDTSSGVISGTPTRAGVFSVIVGATDSTGKMGQTVYSLTISPLITLSATMPPNGSVGMSGYSHQFTASGGSGSYTYALTGGGLPPGLSLSSAGLLSGTPAAWGTYAMTVTATDTVTGFKGSQPYLVTIISPIGFTLDSAALPVKPYSADQFIAIIGQQYEQPLFSGNGDSYTFTLTGHDFTNTPTITNNVLTYTPVPADAGYNYATVRGDDNSSPVNTLPITYDIYCFNPTDVPYGMPQPLPLATVGSNYNHTISLTGAGSPTLSNLVIHDANNNSLGASWNGLTFGTSGGSLTISGAPLAATPQYLPAGSALTLGPITIDVTASYDVAGTPHTAIQEFVFSINPSAASSLTLSGPNSGGLAPATVGTLYAQPITAAGGSGSYYFQFPPGSSQPSWLTLASNGLLSGTPPTNADLGLQSVLIQALDTVSGVIDSRVFQLVVNPPASNPQFNLATLPIAPIGVAYNQTITASGGTGTVTISYTLDSAGSPLPPGLAIQSAGNSLTISGTPQSAAPFDPVILDVTATDQAAHTSRQKYILGVYYTPQQIRHAYGIDSAILNGGIIGDGTGQTVVIIVSQDAPNLVSSTDPNFTSSDLYQFDQLMGLNRYANPLTAPKFIKIDEFGGSNFPAPSAGEAGEITQDVEWVHALAPGANIVLIESGGGGYSNSGSNPISAMGDWDEVESFQKALSLQIAGVPRATVVSHSYSDAEYNLPPGVAALQSVFQTSPSTPITYYICSGDLGNYGASATLQYYGGLPGAVSVGYSQMLLDAQGNYGTEAIVNGSGNGASSYLLQPSWQNGVVNAVSTMKTNPDVSFNGEVISGVAVYQTYGNLSTLNPWTDGDGTSIATPSWAALTAIANQARAAVGLPALNGPTDTLPFLYNAANSGDFHLITRLNDGTTISPGFGRYNWAGLGSPRADLLIPDFAGGINSISGTVTSSSVSNPGAPLANWTVFLDANNNGVLDVNEASTLTSAAGSFSFSSVSPGTYLVREVVPAGWMQASADPPTIKFTGDGQSATANFSNLPAPYAITGLNPAYISDIGTLNGSGQLNITLTTTTPLPVSWYDASQYDVPNNPQSQGITWGPQPLLQPQPALPTGMAPQTVASTDFYVQRIIAAANALIGTQYQHHHDPLWNPSLSDPNWPWSAVSNTPTLFVNTPMQNRDGTWYLQNSEITNVYQQQYGIDWAGIDCSDLTSLTYNVGAGIYIDPAVGTQGQVNNGVYIGPSPLGASNAAAAVFIDPSQSVNPSINAIVPQFIIGPNSVFDPTNQTRYITTFNSPGALDSVVSQLKPGDLLYIDDNPGPTPPTKTFAGTSTAGSTTLTLFGNGSAVPAIKTTVAGPGIPAGTTVTAVSGSTVTLSSPAGAGAGDGTFTFSFTPNNVTHVVIWLGQYGTLADGSPSPVPLVISSHDNTPTVFDVNGNLPPPGVHILPFDPDSWFYQNFSHAMRVLSAQDSLTVQAPTQVIADAQFSVRVSAVDANGGVDTSFNGQISLSLSGAPNGGKLSGVTVAQAVNGVATFSNLSLNVPGSGYTLLAAGNSDLIAQPVSVTVSPTTNFSVAAAQAMTGAGQQISFTVTARTASNQPDSSYLGTIRFTSSDPQALLPADYTFVPGDNGTRTFLATLQTAGNQTISAADASKASAAGMSAAIKVSAAAASTFTVSGFPTIDVINTAHTFTVSARDVYGNIAGGYRGRVHFTSSDPLAALPANYTFTAADNGTHTFAARLKTLGIQSISASDTVTGSITGTQAGIYVASPTTKLRITGVPTTTTAGQQLTITVKALTATNQVDTLFRDTVHFTSTDPQADLPDDFTFTPADNGQKTFTVTLKTAGRRTISVTDTNRPTIKGTSVAASVKAAAASTLSLTGVSSTVTSGVARRLTVTAQDAFGNRAGSYRGTVQITSSDAAAVLPANYPFTAADNGAHVFNVTLTSLGSQTLTATDTATASITGTSDVDVVSSATRLKVTAVASSTAGDQFTITVTALNAANQTDNLFSDTIHFTSTDAQAVLPADFTFSPANNGTQTFNVTLKTAGAQTISVADTVRTAIKGTSARISVQAASASTLRVSGFPSPSLVGVSHPLSVMAVDAFGNRVVSYRGTVTFASSDPQAVLPANYTFTAANNGARSLNVKLKTLGLQSVTVTDTSSGGISGSQTNIQVANLSAGVTGPTTGVRGQPLSYTLTAIENGQTAASLFTYRIDWNGDGIIDQVGSGPSGLSVSHAFALAGTHNVKVTVVDSAGNVSPQAATLPVSIKAVALLPDPGNTAQTALVIGGTTGNNTIVLTPADVNGQSVVVRINGVVQPGGPFAPTGHIFVYGQNGNDVIKLSAATVSGQTTQIAVPALLFGGGGTNTLSAAGSTADNMLIGGTGSDTLTGGTGRNIQIGGAGADLLTAGAGGDVLIGGSTVFDNDPAALLALFAEWSRSDRGYLARVQDLAGQGGGTLNGSNLINAATVQTDTAADQLVGGPDSDWYWTTIAGKIRNYTSGEVVTIDSAPVPSVPAVQVLHNFGNDPDAWQPWGSLTLVGSTLYGRTAVGGSYQAGAIFKIDSNGSGYQVVHSFAGPQLFPGPDGAMVPDGASPHHDSMRVVGNELIGTTVYGGTSDQGVIFAYNFVTGAYRIVHEFTGTATDGAQPHSSPMFSATDGVLYGMTAKGGAHGRGTIFKVDLDGSNFQVLFSFKKFKADDPTSFIGSEPHGFVIQLGGILYGMTRSGGLGDNNGVIFAFDPHIGTYTVLHAFTGAPLPNNPNKVDGLSSFHGGLVQVGGFLYGMTTEGGNSGNGIVFRIAAQPTPASYQILHEFAGSPNDGAHPKGSLVLGPDGTTLYAMTNQGGTTDNGTVFSFNTATKALTILYSFLGYPGGALAIDNPLIAGNIIYAMTQLGGYVASNFAPTPAAPIQYVQASFANGVVFLLPLPRTRPQ